MRRFLLILLVLASSFVVSAQDAPLPLIEAALADLNARLGTSLTLEESDRGVDSWTWDEEDFGDTSLGCPQPDQMYAQVITRGYIITFRHDGTTYDYRASAGGSTLFLCGVTEGEATPESLLPQPEITAAPAGEPITAENAAQVTQIEQVEGNFAAIMDYSPTGNTIAVAGLTIPDPAGNDTPAVLLYNAQNLTAAPQQLLPGGDPVMSLTYLPTSTGASLVTGGMTGTIAIFPVEPEGFDILLIPPPGGTQSVSDVTVSGDGTFIASAHNALTSSTITEQGAYLWNANTGEQIAFLELDTAAMSVAFSPDSQRLAVGDAAGTIHLWDVSAPEAAAEIAALQGHSDAVRDLQFSPDGAVLASGSMDGTVRLWNVSGEPETFSEVAILDSGTGEPVLALDYSPDGALLVSAGGDTSDANASNALYVWNVAAEATPDEPVAVLSGHTGTVGGIAFSPDGTRIASVSGDRTLWLWGLGEED